MFIHAFLVRSVLPNKRNATTQRIFGKITDPSIPLRIIPTYLEGAKIGLFVVIQINLKIAWRLIGKLRL